MLSVNALNREGASIVAGSRVSSQLLVVAQLEGGVGAVAVSSGMAATTMPRYRGEINVFRKLLREDEAHE